MMMWTTTPRKVACAVTILAIANARDNPATVVEGADLALLNWPDEHLRRLASNSRATPDLSECCGDFAESSCLTCRYCTDPSHANDPDCKSKYEQRAWKTIKDRHEAVAKKAVEVEGDAAASGTKGCCFSVSWGARGHPENLKVSLEDLESCKSNGKLKGWRKATCPRNAAEASSMVQSHGGPWHQGEEAVTSADEEPHKPPDNSDSALAHFEGGRGPITLMVLAGSILLAGCASYRCNQARWRRFDEAEVGRNLELCG